ncbi:hypothetical protein PG993_014012 [Apiospora rasikravindrae]|uniref:Uncharacterized protein n=1 Tax=Apiospora rasikravindrae TaxID=990691 RepID=A0ABR1RRT7_9PEZI
MSSLPPPELTELGISLMSRTRPRRPMRPDERQVFANSRFGRLQWLFFTNLGDVRVLDWDPALAQSTWSRLFAAPEEAAAVGPDGGPAASAPAMVAHPLGHKSATDPPRSRMCVQIKDLWAHEGWQDRDMMDQRPAPLVIEAPRDGDRPPFVTVAQFVEQVSAYAKGHEDILRELHCDNGDIGPYFYRIAYGPSLARADNPDAVFSVSIDDARCWPLMEQRWAKLAEDLKREGQEGGGSDEEKEPERLTEAMNQTRLT